MNIRHVWSVVCERSLWDRDTNLMSLINAVEELILPKTEKGFFVIGGPIVMVTMWARTKLDTPVDGKANYIIYAPSGKVVQEQEIDIALIEKHERSRARVNFFNVEFAEAGIYEFTVNFRENEKDEWEQFASVPIKVQFVEKETESEAK